MRNLREEKQLTQEQLAEVFGVSNRSVSRWENGVNMPDFDLVIEIAHYYDVSIEEISDGKMKCIFSSLRVNNNLVKPIITVLG